MGINTILTPEKLSSEASTHFSPEAQLWLAIASKTLESNLYFITTPLSPNKSLLNSSASAVTKRMDTKMIEQQWSVTFSLSIFYRRPKRDRRIYFLPSSSCRQIFPCSVVRCNRVYLYCLNAAIGISSFNAVQKELISLVLIHNVIPLLNSNQFWRTHNVPLEYRYPVGHQECLWTRAVLLRTFPPRAKKESSGLRPGLRQSRSKLNCSAVRPMPKVREQTPQQRCSYSTSLNIGPVQYTRTFVHRSLSEMLRRRQRPVLTRWEPMLVPWSSSTVWMSGPEGGSDWHIHTGPQQ